MDIESAVMTLSRYYPTLRVEAIPHPHVLLADGIVSWVGKIGKQVWLRLVALEPVVDVPGAIPLGDGSVLFPMFQGRGARNRLRTHCLRGHALPVKRNSAGRRQCLHCIILRRIAMRRAGSSGDGVSPEARGR